MSKKVAIIHLEIPVPPMIMIRTVMVNDCDLQVYISQIKEDFPSVKIPLITFDLIEDEYDRIFNIIKREMEI